MKFLNAAYFDSTVQVVDQIVSNVLTSSGLPPLVVASTLMVGNLNVEYLDGHNGAYYLNRSNHTGVQAIGTITGLQTALDLKADAIVLSDYVQRTTSNTISAAHNFTGNGMSLPGSYYRNMHVDGINVYSINYPSAAGNGAVTTFANERVWNGPGGTYKALRIGGDGTFTWDGDNVAMQPWVNANFVPLSRTVSAGTGLTGGGPLSSNVSLAFDTAFGDARYSVAAHTHQTLTRGTGLIGSNYNGSAAATWAIDFGTGTSQVPRGDDSRINNGMTAYGWGDYKLRNLTVSGTAGRITSSAGAQTLAVDRTWTLDLATTGVSANTYKSVTVDAYGRITAGTNPNTLAGYGITDAVSSTTLTGYVQKSIDNEITASHRFTGDGLEFSRQHFHGTYSGTDTFANYYPYLGATATTFANLRVWNFTAGTQKVLRFGGDGTFTWDGISVVLGSRTVSAGAGLTGGGPLSSNISLAFDTAFGDARYSVVAHSHQILTRGVGLTGSNYNGSTAATWAIDFGTGTNQVPRGDDSRINNGQTAYGSLSNYVRKATADLITAGHNFTGDITMPGTSYNNTYDGSNIYRHYMPNGGNGSVVTIAHLRTWDGVSNYKTLRIGGDGIITWAGVNIALESRSISTSNGLLGGGDLSVNRTLSIDFGTGTSQVPRGDDSRINNGQTAYNWGNHASAGYALASSVTGFVRKDTADNITAAHNFTGNNLSLPASIYHSTFDGSNVYHHYGPVFGNGSTITIANIRAWNGSGGWRALTLSGDGSITWNGSNIALESYVTSRGYATESYVNSRGFATEGWVNGNFALYNDGRINNGQTAYTWGNHASYNYLTSINSSMVTSALSYTPMRDDRYINVNGTNYYINSNPTIPVVTGSGNSGWVPKWTGNNSIGDSRIQDTGSGKVYIGGGITTVGNMDITGNLEVNNVTSFGVVSGSSANFDRFGVGITTTSMQSCAKLQVESSTQGLLLPRMTRSQRLAISSPINGLMVYQTDTASGQEKGFWSYENDAWRRMMYA